MLARPVLVLSLLETWADITALAVTEEDPASQEGDSGQEHDKPP